MSLATNIQDLATAIATDIKSLIATRGTMASLTTIEKTNFVGALNELYGMIGAAGASINDTGTDVGSVWSSSKTNTEIGAQISTATAALVDSSPVALNTLNELAAALGDDANFATSTATALGNRVRTDTAAQGLTAPQQSNARTNIAAASATDVGDTTVNFVTTYNTAKA